MLKRTEPKVSVLIANYNNQDYLSECIYSIKDQSYLNIEIILIDDSSSDNSLQKINKFKNEIIIVKKNFNKTRVGSYDQAKSYYECLKVAKGEIIFFCDSDDYFKKDKIESVVKEFLLNKNAQIIYDLPIIKFGDKEIILKRKKKIIKTYWPYIYPTSCIAIKRDCYFKNLEYLDFTDFKDLWLDFRICVISKYLLCENTFLIDKNLTYYRQLGTNVSSNFSFMSKKWWARREQAHEYIKSFFKKNKIHHELNFDYFLTKFVNLFF